MPYLEIPLATDIPANSQAQLLSNFQNLNLWTNVDHYNIGSANVGKHIQVTMPNLGVVPVPAAAESILFSFTSALTTRSELARVTSTGTYSMTEANFAAPGYSRLASGLTIKWGTVSTAGANPKTVTMDTAIVYTAIYAIYCTPLSIANANPGYNVYPVAGSQVLAANTFDVVAFDYAGAAVANTNFSYLVIGL